MAQTKPPTKHAAALGTATAGHWFPNCGSGENRDGFSDCLYSDFDQQAEQFIGHDQTYLQLSPGAFVGRFLSGFLGPDVSIHMEYCNQTLEQEVGGPPDHFTFGIVLHTKQPLRINGRTFAPGDLFVMPPGSELHVISPADSIVLAATFRRQLFLSQISLAPGLREWLSDLRGRTEFLLMQGLAARLHEDAFCALEAATRTAPGAERAFLGQALAAALAARMSLQWTGSPLQDGEAGPRTYTRFRHHRARLMQAGKMNPAEDTSSKRLLQLAFSRNVSMGPLTYSRIVRLHAARRDLIDPACAHLRIGDLAARHGFWDWSTFSGLFRRHFGTLPSQARRDAGHNHEIGAASGFGGI